MIFEAIAVGKPASVLVVDSRSDLPSNLEEPMLSIQLASFVAVLCATGTATQLAEPIRLET